MRDLVDRLPACRWLGEGSSTRWAKSPARLLRRGLELAGTSSLYDPGFNWRTEDKLPPILEHSPGLHLVVQTHLDGLPSKSWAPRLWNQLLDELLALRPDLQIHVLDPKGGSLGKSASPRLHIHDQLSLPQALRLVETADVLLSVDSWSKYVAAWRRIPQLILVPDQSGDYAQLDASTVWRHSFAGLQNSSGDSDLGAPTSKLPAGDLSKRAPSAASLLMK